MKLEKRQTIKTVVCMVHKSKKRRENQFLSRKSRYQAQTCNSHRTFSISHWISIAFCHRLTNNSNNISTHTHTKTSISINEKRKRGGEKAPSLNKYFHSQSANIRKLLLNSGSRELATKMNVDRCGEKNRINPLSAGFVARPMVFAFCFREKIIVDLFGGWHCGRSILDTTRKIGYLAWCGLIWSFSRFCGWINQVYHSLAFRQKNWFFFGESV